MAGEESPKKRRKSTNPDDDNASRKKLKTSEITSLRETPVPLPSQVRSEAAGGGVRIVPRETPVPLPSRVKNNGEVSGDANGVAAGGKEKPKKRKKDKDANGEKSGKKEKSKKEKKSRKDKPAETVESTPAPSTLPSVENDRTSMPPPPRPTSTSVVGQSPGLRASSFASRSPSVLSTTGQTYPRSQWDAPLDPPGEGSITPWVNIPTQLYLKVPTIGVAYPFDAAICSQLARRLLTWHPTLQGLLIAFDNPRAIPPPNSGDTAPAQTRVSDGYADSYLWVGADLLLFKPRRGALFKGDVHVMAESHVSFLAYGTFVVTVERKRLPRQWQWHRDSDTEALQADGDFSAEAAAARRAKAESGAAAEAQLDARILRTNGRWVDGEGAQIAGVHVLRARDFDVIQDERVGTATVAIQATLLSEERDKEMDKIDVLAGGRAPTKTVSGVRRGQLASALKKTAVPAVVEAAEEVEEVEEAEAEAEADDVEMEDAPAVEAESSKAPKEKRKKDKSSKESSKKKDKGKSKAK